MAAEYPRYRLKTSLRCKARIGGPVNSRKEVVSHVRRRLDLPILDWQESSMTEPIIRLHPFKSQLKTPLDTLQRELREMLDKAVALAPC